jgi:putative oxidoreductase
MLKRLLLLTQISLSLDFGRLMLRLIVFVPLFLKHGVEKLFTFGAMAQRFPDPLHIGVIPSLIFAMIADGICSLLIVVGLATRLASVILFINIFVAWAFVHHFALLGKGADHGELIVLYLGACVSLFFTGAGAFSADALIERSGKEERESSSHAGMAQ